MVDILQYCSFKYKLSDILRGFVWKWGGSGIGDCHQIPSSGVSVFDIVGTEVDLIGKIKEVIGDRSDSLVFIFIEVAVFILEIIGS
jgi:hypothetical protein